MAIIEYKIDATWDVSCMDQCPMDLQPIYKNVTLGIGDKWFYILD